MSAAAIELRRLTPEDAAIYRDIRLEGLVDSPHAFASTIESEQTQPLEFFAVRLADSFVLGAFGDGALVGIAGFRIQPGPKHAHKGLLFGMYVRPQARKAGVGRQLVEAIIAHARQNVETLQLFVVSDNTGARRLYANLGFVEYGFERCATKYRGEYHDDVLMALPFMVECGAEAQGASPEEHSA